MFNKIAVSQNINTKTTAVRGRDDRLRLHSHICMILSVIPHLRFCTSFERVGFEERREGYERRAIFTSDAFHRTGHWLNRGFITILAHFCIAAGRSGEVCSWGAKLATSVTLSLCTWYAVAHFLTAVGPHQFRTGYTRGTSLFDGDLALRTWLAPIGTDFVLICAYGTLGAARVGCIVAWVAAFSVGVKDEEGEWNRENCELHVGHGWSRKRMPSFHSC